MSLLRPLPSNYTPQYTKWLYHNPYFIIPGYRNRYMKKQWHRWDGTPWKLDEVSGWRRSELRKVAKIEQSYAKTRSRLELSAAHQRRFNQVMAAVHAGYLQAAITTIRLEQPNDEVGCAVWLLTTSPEHIRNLFLGPMEALNISTFAIHKEIKSLFRLSTIAADAPIPSLLQAGVWRMMALDKFASLDIHRKIAAKSYRLRLKSNARKSPWKEVRDVNWGGWKKSLSYQRDKLGTTASDAYHQAINRRPVFWLAQGLYASLLQSQGLLTIYLDLLYRKAKFQPASCHPSEHQNRLREQAWMMFQRTLDPLYHSLLLDVRRLNRELCAIRHFRIEHFPHSISEREIRLGREFYMAVASHFGDRRDEDHFKSSLPRSKTPSRFKRVVLSQHSKDIGKMTPYSRRAEPLPCVVRGVHC